MNIGIMDLGERPRPLPRERKALKLWNLLARQGAPLKEERSTEFPHHGTVFSGRQTTRGPQAKA